MFPDKISLICFIGIDGSGKTTLAKNITAHLNKGKSNPAIYVYARFKLILSKPVVYIGNKLFLRKSDICENYNEYSNKKKKLFNQYKFTRRIYLNFLFLDYLLQLLFKIKFPMLLGKTVVCDRYVYDTVITDMAVDMNLRMDEVFSLVNRCFLIVPKPSITFLVDVYEETAYNRKDDVPSLEYLTDRRSLYLQLAEHYGMIVLDGNNTSEEVTKSCLRWLDG